MSQFIAGFEVLEKIGEGGMGVVFKARDPQLDRVVALKLLRHGFDNQKLRDRFRQEARAAARLDNPHIVTMFAFGEHGGTPYIAMEFVRGMTLGQLVRLKRPLALTQKLEIVETLCGALGYAHGEGVVHRDIKPSNLMVSASGVLKILDFGLARALQGSGLTHTHSILGTPNYMSPEQFGDPKAVDKRSDIFGVGAVLYELLSYEQAFPGELIEAMNLVLKHEPKPLSELCQGVDPRLEALVVRALSKDPADRFQDLSEMLRQLVDIRRRLEVDVPETRVGVPLGDLVSSPVRADLSAEPSSEELSPWQETARFTGSARPANESPNELPPVGKRFVSSRAGATARLSRSGVLRDRPLWWRVVSGRLATVTALVMAAGAAALFWRLGVPASGPDGSTTPPAAERSIHDRATDTPPADDGAAAGRGVVEGTGLSFPVTQPTQPPVDVAALRRLSANALRRGDLEGAMLSLDEAVALRPDDPDVRKDLDRLLSETRVDVANEFRRMPSAPSDPRALNAYRAATKHRQAATKSAEADDKIDAVKSLLAARRSLGLAIAYASSAETERLAQAEPQALGAQTSTPDVRDRQTTAEGHSTSAPAETGPAASTQPPSPITTSPGATASNLPHEAPNPKLTQAPRGSPAEPEGVETQKKAILNVVEQYREGYERLDASRIRRVWPSAPSDLASSLSHFDRYEMALTEVEVNVEGDSARITCVRNINVQPKAGRRQSTRRPTVIAMQRDANGWSITRIE